ncbi:MAG TPA: 16S rRNA (uracil(1498)-N(3))-methyltransferase [Woeseiaceae bacterium]|nr:16S rRNA (uracil(1498)-N(3))-methyltransferase [Woeseiaceae bacterium]
MKTRLYVPVPLASGASLVLDPERSHYVSRVLRLRAGDELVLFDGSGHEHPGSVSNASRKGVTVSVGAARERGLESPLAVRLIQGLARGDRMDFVVQKATELGVQRITPVITEFSVVRLAAAKADKRVEHWQKIAQGACEQCGRNTVPGIDPPQPLTAVLDARPHGSTRVVLHPGAGDPLPALRIHDGRIELLIGPEGGLSSGELDMATTAGYLACSLGPRILRTETAAMAALAVLQARYGDLA